MHGFEQEKIPLPPKLSLGYASHFPFKDGFWMKRTELMTHLFGGVPYSSVTSLSIWYSQHWGRKFTATHACLLRKMAMNHVLHFS